MNATLDQTRAGHRLRRRVTLVCWLLLSVLLSALPARNASAIANGQNDVNTPTANTVVNVNGCTGTLVSDDEVLTAGHCISTQRPNAAAFANAKGFAHTNGSNYVLGSDGRLWAHTVRAFSGSGFQGVWGPYSTMAPLSATEAIGLKSNRGVDAVNATSRAVRAWGTAPVGTVALASDAARVYAATSSGRLWVTSTAAASPRVWADSGPASGVVTMTVVNGNLYAATSSRLVTRPATAGSATWTDIGHVNGARHLTTFDGRLFLITTTGNSWTRWPVGYEENWQEFGFMGTGYSAMAIVASTFVASQPAGGLTTADVSPSPRNVGRGVTDAVRLTAGNGRLYAMRTNGEIVWRSANHQDALWLHFGTAPAGTTALSADDAGLLWAVTSDRKLLTASALTSDQPWTAVAANQSATQPANIVALGVYRPMTAAGRFYAFTSNGRPWVRSAAGVWTDTGALGFSIPKALAAGVDRMYGLSGLPPVDSVWESHYDKQLFLGVDDQYNTPGRWLTLGSPLPVRFGANSAAYVRETWATQVQFAGHEADIAVVRLAAPVPSTVAIPTIVRRTVPPLTGQTFTIAGWGEWTQPGAPTVRQIGTISGGVTTPVTTFGVRIESNLLQAASRPGEAYALRGDSGGPLFQTIGGTRYVIGVTNTTGGFYQAVWVNSTTDNLGYVHPNTTEWLRFALTR